MIRNDGVFTSRVDTDARLIAPFAVRSSANLGAGIRTSFAGQFNSYLNLKVCDSLLETDQQYARFARVQFSQLTNGEILKQVDDLLPFTKRAAYRNIIFPLLMLAYNHLLPLRLEKSRANYDSLDLMGLLLNCGNMIPTRNW